MFLIFSTKKKSTHFYFIQHHRHTKKMITIVNHNAIIIIVVDHRLGIAQDLVNVVDEQTNNNWIRKTRSIIKYLLCVCFIFLFFSLSFFFECIFCDTEKKGNYLKRNHYISLYVFVSIDLLFLCTLYSIIKRKTRN